MIFDPNDPRCIRLAATITDERDARNAARDYEAERREFAAIQRERVYGSLMRQRTSVCG